MKNAYLIKVLWIDFEILCSYIVKNMHVFMFIKLAKYANKLIKYYHNILI